MAITIIEQPKTHTPLYNDQVVLMSSNLTTNPKFMFGLDVQLIIEELGAFGTVNLGRLKSPAVGLGNTFGFFNVKELLKNSGYFAVKQNIPFSSLSQLIRLIPGEEYASSPSGVATYYAGSAVINSVVFNGALRLNEYIDFVPTDLINTTTIAATSGIGQYLMSSYTQPKDVLKSSLNELTFLCNGGTNSRGVVTYYNGATVLGTQVITATTANRTDVTLNSSYNSLAVPLLTNKYTVVLERISNGNDLSPTYTYNLVDACSKYPTLNVYFQNKWGAYDSFIFNLKSTKNDSINRKTYQKQDRYLTTYNAYDPAIRTYDSEIKTKHTLNTDWITQDQLNWLSELVESNNVQFSYDSDYGGGSPASFEMVVYENSVTNDYGFQPSTQRISAVMGGNTLNFYGSVTDTGYSDIGFYESELLPMLQSSDFASYFNFSATYFGAYFVVKFTAKVNGVGYNLTSLNSHASEQVLAQNAISGVNDTATLIPVTVDNTSFEFKTRDNDKLFQLSLNVTETSVYNRQNQ